MATLHSNRILTKDNLKCHYNSESNNPTYCDQYRIYGRHDERVPPSPAVNTSIQLSFRGVSFTSDLASSL